MTHWFLNHQELKTEVKRGLEKIVAEDVRVVDGVSNDAETFSCHIQTRDK